MHPEDELGSGAYGIVYKVKINGASCIAKKLHSILVGLGGNEAVSRDQWEKLVATFKRECEILGRMHHPNVVQFLGIHYPSRDPREMMLVMEKLHIDLECLIKNYPQTPLALKLHILHDISCGLVHIHSHGVVHRG